VTIWSHLKDILTRLHHVMSISSNQQRN